MYPFAASRGRHAILVIVYSLHLKQKWQYAITFTFNIHNRPKYSLIKLIRILITKFGLRLIFERSI